MENKRTKNLSLYENSVYKRVALAEKLPLKTPFSVDYFLINTCNLRCIFCGYSSPLKEYDFRKRVVLSFDLFKKSIDDMKNFPEKIKTIHFMGYGEPLLHPEIAKMVAYAVESKISEKVDIITNGVLLSRKISNELIAAKLDWLRISVNGLSSNDYRKNCNTNIDFKKFVDNISYFYNNRHSTKVYVRILDYMVATEKRKKMFYNIFRPITDALSIECLADHTEGINFYEISRGITGLTIRGFKRHDLEVCPMPFYFIRINPDGGCTPCCEPRFKISLGNISKSSLPEIWNGPKFNRFRYLMLKRGIKNIKGICRRCRSYIVASTPEDILDSEIARLKQLYATK